VSNGYDPSQILDMTPMRWEGRKVTGVQFLRPDTPSVGERPEPRPPNITPFPLPFPDGPRQFRSMIDGWPPHGTWPPLIAEAVYKAGLLDPPPDVV
jgi:hypothetical protein